MISWRKSDTSSKDEVESAKLCKQRDRLLAELPRVQAEWNQIDEAEVWPAAAASAAAAYCQNPARVLACRDALQTVIQKRDGVLSKFHRELDRLAAEIEGLNAPVIAEQVQRWRANLLELHALRENEIIERYTDHNRERRMVRLKSNSTARIEARDQLNAAVKKLGNMRDQPLKEIREFISETEAALEKLDVHKMVEDDSAISESKYHDVLGKDDPKVVQDMSARNFHKEGEAQRLLRKAV